MVLWLLLFSCFSHGSEVTHLELGEHKRISEKFSKIWVENQKIVQIQEKNNNFYIKSLNTGVTHIRLDNKLIKIIISPLATKKTYTDWLKLANKFVGLKPEYCGAYVCLAGTLYRSSDYLRILALIEQYQSKLYLSLKVDKAIEAQLQKLIQLQLRQRGLTPLKVQFTTPWKIYYAKAKYKKENESDFNELGIRLEYLTHSTDIADNIKVAVKVAEITKNFERKLGIRWPDSYQAQVINNSHFVSENSFDLAINAAEKAGEAKILASPNLICRSGKEADFFAGGEFPIKVLGLRAKEIQWKRYGIGLKLKPIIDALGQMSLHIETEVSTLDRSITVDDVPALHTNRVSSYFDLISSRTIAISGLIKSEVSENTEGIPFLKNLPVLGALFSSKNFQENKSELIIFVTTELME